MGISFHKAEWEEVGGIYEDGTRKLNYVSKFATRVSVPAEFPQLRRKTEKMQLPMGAWRIVSAIPTIQRKARLLLAVDNDVQFCTRNERKMNWSSYNCTTQPYLPANTLQVTI